MSDKKEAAPPAEGEAAAAPTPKSKKGSLILFLIIGVVLGAGGLGAVTLLGHKSKAAEPEKAAETAAAAGEKRKTQVVTLKPIVVNLRNSKGTRYLKVTVGMETASEDVSKELQNLSPQITDFLVEKFSNVEVSDVDNTAGRNRLKREILTGTNELLQNGYVNTVYFTEFMIQ